MLTIVETPEFIANADTLMPEPEREALIGYLAQEPDAGNADSRDRGRSQIAMGSEWTRQAGWRPRHLLLSLRSNAAVPVDRVCEEPASGLVAGRTEWPSKTDQATHRELQEVTAMSKAGHSIRRGLEQAIHYAGSTKAPRTFRVHVPPHVDVRAIRTKLGLTQEAFAARFGFSINTLRHWEQGKREPEGPTRAYLLVIERAPRAVEKALKIA